MMYAVTLCNEDGGVGDTLEVEASSERQALLQAIYAMDWRDHERATVFPDHEVQGWAVDSDGIKFYFSGFIREIPAGLMRLREKFRLKSEELKALRVEADSFNGDDIA